MARLPVIRLGAVAAAVAALAIGSAAAMAAEIENWPCKFPYHDALTADDVWGGPPPAVDGDWHQDEAVSKVVYFATNPENAPASGREAIADFAKQLGGADEKERGIGLALKGMVDETNVLRSAVIAGIRDLRVKGVILGDAVKEDDAALAKLPEDADKERASLKTARHFNFRGKDDAEDGTDFMCHRLGYIEKKMQLLSDQLRTELNSK